tara:strand:+ start:1000 stop:1104 length:105 start_codon:yes stop_codon:yes gene_type:complete
LLVNKFFLSIYQYGILPGKFSRSYFIELARLMTV